MTKAKAFSLSLIVPMYNEEEGVDIFFKKVLPIVKSATSSYEIVCINDGSKDGTLKKLEAWSKKDKKIKLIDLSRNFGKEAALTAGLDFASGDAVIPFDADLQDPPELIPDMIAKWQEGYDVVLATRKSRNEEGFIKRFTAESFYKVIGSLSKVPIPRNTGDFRLMDRKVVEVIKLLPEKSRFMKGIFAWAGFKTTAVHFNRPKRAAGNAKQSYWKLFKLAVDGIVSFTSKPLKIWLYLGLFFSIVSFAYAIYLILKTLIFGVELPGYASLMVAILFMGGLILVSLGVIGEYISRIFKEVKGRPIYIVDKKYGFEKSKKK